MFTILTNFPDDVLAVKASGTITPEDYDSVMVPAVEAMIRRPFKVFISLGPDYKGLEAGAMVADIRLGIHHLKDWSRVAVVTDAAGIRDMVILFGMFLKRPLKVFSNADYDKAKAWIGTED